jgi:hypothetical protein
MTDVGNAVGAASGGAIVYLGLRHVAGKQRTKDLASTWGSLRGSENGSLSSRSKFLTAYRARRFARTVLDTHAPNTNPLLRTAVLDGITPRVAAKFADRQAVVNYIGGIAENVAERNVSALKLINPRLGALAESAVDDATKLARGTSSFAITSYNAMQGAQNARSVLRGTVIAGAVVGAVGGAFILDGTARSAMDKVSGWLGMETEHMAPGAPAGSLSKIST